MTIFQKFINGILPRPKPAPPEDPPGIAMSRQMLEEASNRPFRIKCCAINCQSDATVQLVAPNGERSFGCPSHWKSLKADDELAFNLDLFDHEELELLSNPTPKLSDIVLARHRIHTESTDAEEK